MLRRLLLITILATIGLANAQDGADAAQPFGVLSGSTVTCSVTSVVAGCYAEKPVATFGNLEVSIGVDAQAAWDGRYTGNQDVRETALGGHLAPYVGFAWYDEAWSAWAELYSPRLGIPTLGRSDWFRLGFSWRIP